MNSYTQEEHDKFIDLFKHKESFCFHPEKIIDIHLKKLEQEYYVKECMIRWLEHKKNQVSFTKKECYQAIGLQKANKPFNTFWSFLIAPRMYGHYMYYDKETKTWVFLS